MDIQQPQNFLAQQGGFNRSGAGNLAQTRFYQDLYRAVKTPNFAVGKNVSQDIASHNSNWTTLTWPVVYHNNLSCFNTSTNVCQPAVPGYYMIHCSIPFEFNGGGPASGSFVHLAICTPAGIVRASSNREWTTNDDSGITYFMHVHCLDYIDGVAENQYRSASVFNNTNRTMRVLSSFSGSEYAPRFQAFKIAY